MVAARMKAVAMQKVAAMVALYIVCSLVGRVGGQLVAQDVPLPDNVATVVSQALQEAGGYSTAALLVPYLKSVMLRRSTLLVPSDAAIAAAIHNNLLLVSGDQLRSLAKYHMITSNLSFSDLLKLPAGTLLPTLLGGVYRLEILHSFPDDYMIGNAHIKRKDLCPRSISSFVTCQGIDHLLLAGASLNTTGTNPSAPSAHAPPPPPPDSNPRLASSPSMAPSPPANQTTTVTTPDPASPTSGARPPTLQLIGIMQAALFALIATLAAL